MRPHRRSEHDRRHRIALRADKRSLIAYLGITVALVAAAVLAPASLDDTAGADDGLALERLPGAPAVAIPHATPAADSGPIALAGTRPPSPAAPEPRPRARTRIITEGELVRGDTLASALRRSNVPQDVIHRVSRGASAVFDFRRAQPGHSFRLVQGLDGEVLDFRYRLSPTESIHLAPEGGDLVARRETAELTPRVARIAGVVTSSLYGAVRDLGEEPRLAHDFTDVFAWDVDFSRTVQPGDEFRALYERLYYRDADGDEVYAGPGRILAARYGGAVGGEHTAIYFESEEGRGGYYRPDGTSVEREFLMAPLQYSRISSSFSAARRHPILNVTRPHHGIDYAARIGTPVWSVADGEVIYRGWAGGFGNLVKIRHADGYVSYYGHLSRFAAGLRVGEPVQQKQVIGYVGQTGLATGPHVCFRIARNGHYVNPARIASPAATPIPEGAREAFYAARDELLAELDAGPFVATGEAL